MIKSIILSITIPLILFLSSIKAAELESSQKYTAEIITCKPYTAKELSAIKASNNPALISGARIVELVISPTSTVGRDLLAFGSQRESPKGVATPALIINRLNSDLSLKPLRYNIAQFLKDKAAAAANLRFQSHMEPYICRKCKMEP